MSLHKLKKAIQTIIKQYDIPGMAIGIIKDDEVLYEDYHGIARLDHHKPIANQSIFCVTSVSKTFTAFGVMRLVENGLIGLDDYLIKHLPDLKMADDRYRKITIRMLLSHTSGLGDISEEAYNDIVKAQDTTSHALEDAILSLKDMSLEAEPGETFIYSNIGYNLLGYMLQKLSNESFEAFMKEEVLVKAGMHSSSYLLQDIEPLDIVWPHVRIPLPLPLAFYPYNRSEGPSGNLHATLPDMLSFIKTLLNEPAKLCLSETLDVMVTPHMNRGYPPYYASCGLGFNVGEYHGHNVLSHGGMGFGWSDFLMIYPEDKLGVIIMSNEESDARDVITDLISSYFFDETIITAKPSWMTVLHHIYKKDGKERMLIAALHMMKDPESPYNTDPWDLYRATFQMSLADQKKMANDYLEVFNAIKD